MPKALILFSIALVGCGGNARSSCGSSTVLPGVANGSATVPQQIVFEMTGGSPAGPNVSSEIGLIDLDGSNLRQLTSDGKFKFLPHFSPDGTKIAYTKYEAGGYGAVNAQADVAVLDLATGMETMVTCGGAGVDGTWSPDGTRLAYLAGPGSNLNNGVNSIWIVNADGSNAHQIAVAAGTPDDEGWGDLAWSRDDWILFTVIQKTNGCFKVRTDKIRSDGSSRTQISDGGPNCTPPGFEQSGDADPGWSPDGKTIYSSRGFPNPPPGLPAAGNPYPAERKLYAFSSDAWYPGKPEVDLSDPSEPDCIEGTPKVSPDGPHILVGRACFDRGAPKFGIYLTDTTGNYRTFVFPGFGADWNPAAPELRRRAVSH